MFSHGGFVQLLVKRIYEWARTDQRRYTLSFFTMGNTCSNHLGIPPAKGPNAVGCTDFMMDHTAQGTFFRLYYPCQETEKAEKPDWVPSREYFNGLADFMKINRTLSERIFSYLMTSNLHQLYAELGLRPSAPRMYCSQQTFDDAVLFHDSGPEGNRRRAAKRSYSAMHGPIRVSPDFIFPDGKLTGKLMKLKGRDWTQSRHRNGSYNISLSVTPSQCGIALDAWMFPLDDETFPRVKQPIFFINSEKFQWAGNISRMKKLDSAVIQRKMITIRGTVHQSFPDFTFLTGNWIGKLMKLKGEIDPEVAIDLSNKATLAFLQRHLGLEKNFNQWDPLIDGQDDNLIQGTNITLLQSSI
ncbi:platelet-activating factor acetylhydrolase isoform X1 [Lates japonicus]|uniref:1-alkyl-2-acetylglycerophosphocholine esterase n=1 Tax=Lates japonicus TaxID=270547 RepID=A0AAD3MQQ3_LATJO|nr:platelet-activating factor acetylhydrolase isoform X1 [Lates japonicus]